MRLPCNDDDIEARPLAKGAVVFDAEGIKATIHAFEAADFSTLVHENAHVFRRVMKDVAERTGNKQVLADLATIEEWAGVKDGVWTVKNEEHFARGFEKYIATGEAPTPKLRRAFESFKTWMLEIYKTITGSAIDVKITDEVKGVFDRMLGGKIGIMEWKEKMLKAIDQSMEDYKLTEEYKKFKPYVRTITGKTVDIKKLSDPAYFVEAYDSTFAAGAGGTDEALYKIITKQLVPSGKEPSGYLADLYTQAKQLQVEGKIEGEAALLQRNKQEITDAQKARRLADMKPVPVDSRNLGDPSDIKNLKENALNRYLSLEKVTNNDSGKVIEFPRSGFDKTISHKSEGAINIRVIQNLDEIMKDAIYLFNEPDKRNRANIEAVHHYVARVNIDGEQVLINLIVREEGGGKNFYYDNLVILGEDMKAASAILSAVYKAEELGGSNSKSRILQWLEKVNKENVNNPNALFQSADQPMGTVDAAVGDLNIPHASIMDEGYKTHLRPLLEKMREVAMEQVNASRAPLDEKLPPEGQAMMRKYMQQVKPRPRSYARRSRVSAAGC